MARCLTDSGPVGFGTAFALEKVVKDVQCGTEVFGTHDWAGTDERQTLGSVARRGTFLGPKH